MSGISAPTANEASDAPAATSGDGSSPGSMPSSSSACTASAFSGSADAAGAEHRGQLRLLGRGVVLEFQPLLVDLGLNQLVLGGDRDELAGCHGARARG